MKIQVCWARKSFVGCADPVFDVLAPADWPTEDIRMVDINRVEVVLPTVFDRVAQTLGDLPRTLGNLSRPFVIMDGTGWLAVDCRGYDYPRYKSLLEEMDIEKLEKVFLG